MANPLLLKRATQEKMEQTLRVFESEIKTLRAAGQEINLLESLDVNYFGQKTPLKSLAHLSSAGENFTLVTPYDKNMANEILGSIQAADLGLTALLEGQQIKVTFPPLSEENRRQMVKILREKAESARIAFRNIRQKTWEEVQRMEKKKELTEDDRFRLGEDLNKLIEQYNNKIEDLVKSKEKEILS